MKKISHAAVPCVRSCSVRTAPGAITRQVRKHGYNARRVHLQLETDTRQAGTPGERLKTMLTFETDSQAYLWTTDRGRSRLIKH